VITGPNTKLLIEMFPGVLVGVTIPTRYLVWRDDKLKNPEFNPGFWRLFRAGEFTIEVER
jgi:hypothetical protein